MIALSAVLDETLARCEAALRAPELSDVAARLQELGYGADKCVSLVRSTADTGEQAPVVRLKKDLEAAEIGHGSGTTADGSLERWLLVNAALQFIRSVPDLPVSVDVQRLFFEAFQLFSRPPDKRTHAIFQAGGSSFLSVCRMATLQRFPAGEFEWEVTGLPRSWLLQVERRALPRLATFLVKLGGFSPLLYPHLGALRPKRIMLVEREINRSYYRIASSMRLQPKIKGMFAQAWFFSPDTHIVSPHLAWLTRCFVENGGFVCRMGATSETGDGALSRSNRRKQLYESGEFRPTRGLVLWPRDAMLRWAANHPELAD